MLDPIKLGDTVWIKAGPDTWIKGIVETGDAPAPDYHYVRIFSNLAGTWYSRKELRTAEQQARSILVA